MRTRLMRALFGMAVTSSMGLLLAQGLRVVHFKGMINDYSPSVVTGGPYEMHGPWSLDVQNTGTATFTADLTMETSDYGISNATAVDPANPATRSPHTHHISMINAVVTYDTSGCPVYSPPTTGPGIVVTGTVATTGEWRPGLIRVERCVHNADLPTRRISGRLFEYEHGVFRTRYHAFWFTADSWGGQPGIDQIENKQWWAVRDSNPGPLRCKRSALTS